MSTYGTDKDSFGEIPEEDPKVDKIIKSLVYLLERYKRLCDAGLCTEEDQEAYQNCIEALKIYNNED